MNSSHHISLRLESRERGYEVIVGSRILGRAGEWVRKCLSPTTSNITLVSNQKVFDLYGSGIIESLKASGFSVLVWLMSDGEEFKDIGSLESLITFLAENRTNRSGAIVGLGGGVVGDLAGFASAIYMRGIPFLQIPTTLLAMIDASVGGKTAVNLGIGKNLVGSFHQPSGVLVDVRTLETLEHRELAAGFYEAIKHGAIGGENLLRHTATFLQDYPINEFSAHFDRDEFARDLVDLVTANVEFKAGIVVGDEREEINRKDNRSRKILNFGHTVGHALEKVTEYKYFKHGEAIGYGMLAAAEISKRLELIGNSGIRFVNDVVTSVGKLPDASNIDLNLLYKAFSADKKTNSESLDWVLLRGIGEPVIVENSEIPQELVIESLQRILLEKNPR